MNMPVARQQYLDGNGAPLVGGKVAFCQPNTGGATYLPVYADMQETIPLTNPVPLDAAGITMSGGSQVSVWGSGGYEQFVYDSDDNLIYSAKVDASTQVGNDFSGTVTIAGNLSVTGSITDTQSLTTPLITGQQANFSGTVQAGALTGGSVTGSSLISTGGLSVASNASIGGTTNLTTANVTNGNVTNLSAGSANLNGGNISNVGTLQANIVQANNLTGVPKVQGGAFTTNVNTSNYTITFPQAFNAIFSGSVTNGIGADGSLISEACIIVSMTTTQMQIVVPFATTPDPASGLTTTYTIYWIAVGT